MTWMQTYTRKKIDFDRVTPRDIEIHDIARALSHLCRFGGHVKKFYSVAQHSVMVSEIVPPEHQLAGLLHDAAEAYVGDIIWPVKSAGENKSLARLEQYVQQAIDEAFGLKGIPQCVKDADCRMLLTEARDLFDGGQLQPMDWHVKAEQFPPLEEPIEPWGPDEAMQRFLFRYKQITKIGSDEMSWLCVAWNSREQQQ